jgi:hypothetical protein
MDESEEHTVTEPIVLWSLEDWADAVARLPAHGPLPRRNVLVPNERVAHSLRRTLVAGKQHAALAGTRFVPLVELARELLANAGEPLTVNDAEVTPALVRQAFATVKLERLDAVQLAELPGWDHAFARTITELEAAQIAPDELLAHADAHVRDVGKIFAAVVESAGRTSMPGLFRKTMELLRLRPAHGSACPTLVAVTGFESAAEVALLKLLPSLTWAVWAVRPLREAYLARLQGLYGAPFAEAVRHAAPVQRRDTALAVLKSGMNSVRESSAANDVSVEVVTYAGVHDEVEAAAGWVVEQISEHGLRARDIALVSPTPDAYASLLRARLRAMAWPEDDEPVLLERGSPVLERADGARVVALVRALREGLPRECLATLLPWLKAELKDGEPEQQQGVRGLSQAWDVLNCVACIGGERSHLGLGLRWSDAWRRAQALLEAQGAVGEDPRAARQREKLKAELAALGPAVAGLTEVLALVTTDRPLGELWASLRRYIEVFLKLPPASPPVWALLETAVRASLQDEALALRGAAALDWLEEQLVARLVRTGRFGMPAVYLGSLQGLRGLSFCAVRVLGLVEGALPSAVREDAVLSDAARLTLSPYLPTSRSRAHRQLCSLDDALRATRERLVLSAPQVSLEGGARQPAAVLLDVMRALGVSANALEDTLAERAQATRARERHLREVLPVSAGARLLRVAAGDRAHLVTAPSVVSLNAMRVIMQRSEAGAQDGLLPGLIARTRLPGLTADTPISASRLGTLLSCPHRHLYENVLYFRPPSGPLPSHELNALSFGSLLHTVAEAFYNEHGADFGARKYDLARHQLTMRARAEASFRAFCDSYPFANESIAQAQCDEFLDQLSKLLEHDWQQGAPRAFVAVERGFGYDEPCALETHAGPLYVHGRIDRLDVERGEVLVRDLKTGRSKPRRADEPPSLNPDLQLGLYARVTQKLAPAWGLPAKVGVAYVYLRSGELERRWSGADYDRLQAASGEWLATAVDILEHGAFARTADTNDCQYCEHKIVCESEHVRTKDVLSDPRVPHRLRVLKPGEAQ